MPETARKMCGNSINIQDNLFNDQDDNITKHVFKEEIAHYRKLTKFVIGHLRSWK